MCFPSVPVYVTAASTVGAPLGARAELHGYEKSESHRGQKVWLLCDRTAVVRMLVRPHRGTGNANHILQSQIVWIYFTGELLFVRAIEQCTDLYKCLYLRF